MPALLVSVRSAEEAQAAWGAGADVIDVKEPGRGPLGPADPATWASVRSAVPAGTMVSIALGELSEWQGMLDPQSLAGVAYCKLGLAGAAPGWRDRLLRIRRSLRSGPDWVAVAYVDWEQAGAPAPAEVFREAVASGCRGILFDTWDKARSTPLDSVEPWAGWIREARDRGLFIALAGGLDARAIARLAPLQPDLFAVRGAACVGGDRLGRIDPARVARLARIVRESGPPAAGRHGTFSRTSRS